MLLRTTNLQTGSILFEGKHLTHWEYCLNPVPTDNNDEQSNRLDLKALVCPDSEEPVTVAGKQAPEHFCLSFEMTF